MRGGSVCPELSPGWGWGASRERTRRRLTRSRATGPLSAPLTAPGPGSAPRPRPRLARIPAASRPWGWGRALPSYLGSTRPGNGRPRVGTEPEGPPAAEGAGARDSGPSPPSTPRWPPRTAPSGKTRNQPARQSLVSRWVLFRQRSVFSKTDSANF